MIINIKQWNWTLASNMNSAIATSNMNSAIARSNMNSAIARSNSLKYKYQRFSSTSYKDIGVRKYM